MGNGPQSLPTEFLDPPLKYDCSKVYTVSIQSYTLKLFTDNNNNLTAPVLNHTSTHEMSSLVNAARGVVTGGG